MYGLQPKENPEVVKERRYREYLAEATKLSEELAAAKAEQTVRDGQSDPHLLHPAYKDLKRSTGPRQPGAPRGFSEAEYEYRRKTGALDPEAGTWHKGRIGCG